MATLLSKERSIAGPAFNRWLIPPCALATHLCIGQAYALSVFNLPLTRQLGIDHSTPGDWKLDRARRRSEALGFPLERDAERCSEDAAVLVVVGRALFQRHGGDRGLLTAWSAAGVLGPVLVNYIREAQIAQGVPKYEAYNVTMYIMAGLLAIAFFANLAVKAVSERYTETAEDLAGASPKAA